MSDDRTFTAEEVDAAVASLTEPGRLDHAQDVITHAAPGLQRILAEALGAGGYFDGAHDGVVTKAAAEEDPEARLAAVRTLLAEETRLAMLIGAAVGFELARELGRTTPAQDAASSATPDPPQET